MKLLFQRAIVALVFAAGLFCSAKAADQYTLTKLGSTDSTFSQAYALNDSGQITLRSVVAGTETSVVYFFQNRYPIPNLAGSIGSFPFAINRSGHVAGASSFPGSAGERAFFYDQTTTSDLGTLAGGSRSLAYAINDSDAVAGYIDFTNGTRHAFLSAGGILSDLGTLGGVESAAKDINNSGQVVGYSRTSTGEIRAFITNNGVMTDLFTATGGLARQATAINNAGTVVGRSANNRAFIYSNGVATELGTLGGAFSEAYAINDAGHVVGYSSTATGTPHPFFYAPSIGMIDLCDTVTLSDGTAPGFTTLETAEGINGPGWIIGRGTYFDGVSTSSQAFLLTPKIPAEAPQYSPWGGTFYGPQVVTITTTTPGATIRYTTDGVTSPTSTVGNIYTGPITVSASLRINAIAYGGGFTESASPAATFTILPSRVAAPAFSPDGGTFQSAQLVTISSATPDAEIRYTTDGSTPTATQGIFYAAPLTISATSTLQAIAYAAGFSDSTVSAATFTFAAAPVAPTFTAQPHSVSINPGTTAIFAAAASGTPLPTYQWEASPDNGLTWSTLVDGGHYFGASSGELTVSGVTNALNAYRYRCVATNSAGTATTWSAILIVNGASVVPWFTTQPISQSVAESANLSFAISAAGSPIPTYRWQVSTNSGSTWTNLFASSLYANVSSPVLNIAGVTAALHGYQYRCVATNQMGSANSNPATLTVQGIPITPSFTAHPQNRVVDPGSNVTFTVSAGGTPLPTFQWQISANNGNTWSAVTDGTLYSGSTSNTLVLTNATNALHLNRYRCVATNSAGNATSGYAILAVNSAPAFTTQPSSQSVNSGATAVFTVLASGTPSPTYLWEVSPDNGLTWTTLANGSLYSGVSTRILTVTGASDGLNGHRYRCVASNNQGAIPSNPATLTVTVAPTFTVQPVNQTFSEGDTLVLTTMLTGSPAELQWHFSTDNGAGWTAVSDNTLYSGSTLSVLNITGATAALNDSLYRCTATNGAGFAISDPAKLTLVVPVTAPSFTVQPENQTFSSGDTVVFTTQLSGSPADLQWEGSWDNGTSWTFLGAGGQYSGTNTNVFTINGANRGLNNYLVRCVAANTAGSTVSAPARLTLLVTGVAPTFTTQPSDQTFTPGDNVVFTTAVTGTAPEIAWSVSTDNGQLWGGISDGTLYSGTNSTTLTISAATAALDGYLYRCSGTNDAGYEYSIPARLSLFVPATAPSFTTQPSSQTVTVGGSVCLTVVAAGTAPDLRWQVSLDGGSLWSPITDGSPYFGATTDALFISEATIALNDVRFRCTAINTAGFASSEMATLTVNLPSAAPSFTIQPTHQTAISDSFATFVASASGNPAPTYRWQVKNSGGSSWANVTNSSLYSGATTGTLTVTTPWIGMTGSQYRCVATNELGMAISSAAALTVTPPIAPFFTTQPSSQTVTAGGSVSFSAAAFGNPTPTYQWQVKPDGTNTWTNLANKGPYSGTATATLTITAATLTLDGYQYRCVATNRIGTATSNARTLTVVALPSFTTQPTNQTVTAGAGVSFTVAATGTPTPTYQWQLSTNAGSTWANLANSSTYSGAKTTTLTIATATSVLNGLRYRCVATNSAGTTTSNIATLTVLTNSKLSTPPSSVTASAHDGNVPSNTVDNSLSTRWSASGDGQWIKYNLGTDKRVAHVKIAFYNGTSRTCYFDIQVSSDNVTFTTVRANVSSARNANLQTFDFPDSEPVRYVRILGHGNSDNAWNSYTEAEIWGGQ